LACPLPFLKAGVTGNNEVEPERVFMKKCFSPSRLLFCLLFLFGSQAAHAQFRLDHWTADNGLPQNCIRDIVQTRDGYLWLATHDGLVRFDGVRFTVFDKSNSPGIITNRFMRLYEDAQGDLWAATEYLGLTRLHQGRFVTYTTETGLPGNRIEVLGEDGYGNLMFFFGNHPFRWLMLLSLVIKSSATPSPRYPSSASWFKAMNGNTATELVSSHHILMFVAPSPEAR
jgi:hypothetical protein